MGRKSGIITRSNAGKDNEAYHDIITLLKIYRSVNWRMQVKIAQVKRSFQAEYGSDVDEFLNQIYEAGLDLNDDAANIRVMVYSGKFYTPSNRRIAYMKDKTFDERYYILTLIAVARELEDRLNRGIYRPVPNRPVGEEPGIWRENPWQMCW